MTMTNIIVTAHFGETIREMTTIDAFAVDTPEWDHQAIVGYIQVYLEDNRERFLKEYPNALRFSAHQQVGSII